MALPPTWLLLAASPIASVLFAALVWRSLNQRRRRVLVAQDDDAEDDDAHGTANGTKSSAGDQARLLVDQYDQHDTRDDDDGRNTSLAAALKLAMSTAIDPNEAEISQPAAVSSSLREGRLANDEPTRRNMMAEARAPPPSATSLLAAAFTSSNPCTSAPSDRETALLALGPAAPSGYPTDGNLAGPINALYSSQGINSLQPAHVQHAVQPPHPLSTALLPPPPPHFLPAHPSTMRREPLTNAPPASLHTPGALPPHATSSSQSSSIQSALALELDAMLHGSTRQAAPSALGYAYSLSGMHPQHHHPPHHPPPHHPPSHQQQYGCSNGLTTEAARLLQFPQQPVPTQPTPQQHPMHWQHDRQRPASLMYTAAPSSPMNTCRVVPERAQLPSQPPCASSFTSRLVDETFNKMDLKRSLMRTAMEEAMEGGEDSDNESEEYDIEPQKSEESAEEESGMGSEVAAAAERSRRMRLEAVAVEPASAFEAVPLTDTDWSHFHRLRGAGPWPV